MLCTAITVHGRPVLARDVDNSRYSALEIQQPEYYGLDKILPTKKSDMYGIAMVIYEARPSELVSLCPTVRSHANILGFNGK